MGTMIGALPLTGFGSKVAANTKVEYQNTPEGLLVRRAQAGDETAFREGVAESRTFGFLHEVEALRQAGLIGGGALENAIVIDGDAVLNPEGLKRPDEFVRHKAVDAIGDLATLGAPLIGRYEGRYAGHAMNNALARALLDRPEAFCLRPLSPALAEAV